MNWTSVEKGLPEPHKKVRAIVQHFQTRKRHEVHAFRVDEDDCLWRVWDLGYSAELAHEWNVIYWMPLPRPPEEA